MLRPRVTSSPRPALDGVDGSVASELVCFCAHRACYVVLIPFHTLHTSGLLPVHSHWTPGLHSQAWVGSPGRHHTVSACPRHVSAQAGTSRFWAGSSSLRAALQRSAQERGDLPPRLFVRALRPLHRYTRYTMSLRIHVSVTNTLGTEALSSLPDPVRRLHAPPCRVRPRIPYLDIPVLGLDPPLLIARHHVQDDASMPSDPSGLEKVSPQLSDYECHDILKTAHAEISSAFHRLLEDLPPSVEAAAAPICLAGPTEAYFEVQLKYLPIETPVRRHPAVSATWPRPPEARFSPSASRIRPTAAEPPALFEPHVQGPCQHGQPFSFCDVCRPSINSVVHDSLHPAVLASPSMTPLSMPPKKRRRVAWCDEAPSPADSLFMPAVRLADPPPVATTFSGRHAAVHAALPVVAPCALQPEVCALTADSPGECSPGTQALVELLSTIPANDLFGFMTEDEICHAFADAAGPFATDHGGSPSASSSRSGDGCEHDYGDSDSPHSTPDSSASFPFVDSLPSSDPPSPASA